MRWKETSVHLASVFRGTLCWRTARRPIWWLRAPYFPGRSWRWFPSTFFCVTLPWPLWRISMPWLKTVFFMPPAITTLLWFGGCCSPTCLSRASQLIQGRLTCSGLYRAVLATAGLWLSIRFFTIFPPAGPIVSRTLERAFRFRPAVSCSVKFHYLKTMKVEATQDLITHALINPDCDTVREICINMVKTT